jgi:hypothetical protein
LEIEQTLFHLQIQVPDRLVDERTLSSLQLA